MRYRFLCIAALFLSGCLKLTSDDNTVMVEYDEPTKNADGTPLDDLNYILFDFYIDGVNVKKKISASKPAGGGHLIYSLAMLAESYQIVRGRAYAVDFSGNVSPASAEGVVLGKKLPRINPVPSPTPPPLPAQVDTSETIVWWMGPAVSSGTIMLSIGATNYTLMTSTTDQSVNSYFTIPSTAIPGAMGIDQEFTVTAVGYEPSDSMIFYSSFTVSNDLLPPAQMR